MSKFTRTLTFRTNDIGRDSDLLLTFDDSKIPDIYRGVFPIAFKVNRFGAKGPQEFTVIYNSQLAFTRTQIHDRILVPASTWIPINAGQKTVLTKGYSGIYSFSKPEDIEPPIGVMIAENGTSMREDIGIGFLPSPDREPSQVLVFENIPPMSFVQSQFTPILGGYITSDYKENEVLRGQVSTPLLFKEDLVRLPEHSYWKIVYDHVSGRYTIIRDN